MDTIGKSKRVIDQLDPARAAAMHAMLDLSGPPPNAGDALPPFWHYAYFWEGMRPIELGRDGHPRTGDFIPDLGLPRRMWAGGDLQFDAPLIIGQAARKKTKIVNVERKDARTGSLGIVTLRHELSQDGRVCVTEEQSLIYRGDADLNAPKPVPPIAPTDETVKQTRKFSSTDLFRYSALSFNGHRIHYDRDYAINVEGYDGLIVHGPLLAQNLLNLAQSLLGSVRTFRFRATAPLFDFEAVAFCAKPEAEGISLWARGPDGRMCLSATAT